MRRVAVSGWWAGRQAGRYAAAAPGHARPHKSDTPSAAPLHNPALAPSTAAHCLTGMPRMPPIACRIQGCKQGRNACVSRSWAATHHSCFPCCWQALLSTPQTRAHQTQGTNQWPGQRQQPQQPLRRPLAPCGCHTCSTVTLPSVLLPCSFFSCFTRSCRRRGNQYGGLQPIC